MKTIFLIAFSCYLFPIYAQVSYLEISNGCSYDDELSSTELYVYDPSNEAERIVSEILDALGVSKNFTVRSSNVPNALATTNNGLRYVFYSTSFLENFKKDANTKWAAYSVMAHEIGHHVNGHNFAETNPKIRKMLELEADQFSGSVLRMLGATLEEAQAGLNTFDLQGETKTHPPLSARKEAVSNGWKKRDEWLKERNMVPAIKPKPEPVLYTEKRSTQSTARKNTPDNPSQPPGKTAAPLGEEWESTANRPQTSEKKVSDNHELAHTWLAKGMAEKNDMAKREQCLSNAILLEPDYAEAYSERGWSRYKQENLSGALSDYDQSIQLSGSNPNDYYFRANIKERLNNSIGALEDYTMAIQKNPNDPMNFARRGQLKIEMGKYAEGVVDLDRAIQIKPDYDFPYACKGCLYVELKRYTEAITLLDKALLLDSTDDWARMCRNEALEALGRN